MIKIQKKGFTLVEVLIAAFVFLVVILVGTAIFSSSIGAKMRVSVLWQNQQEAQYAIEMMNREIRNSNSFYFFDDRTGLGLCDVSRDCDYDKAKKIISLYTTDKGIGVLKVDDRTQGRFYYLTSSDKVNITFLFITGYRPLLASKQQPYVTIKIVLENIGGQAAQPTARDSVALKTMVNLRNYEYK